MTFPAHLHLLIPFSYTDYNYSECAKIIVVDTEIYLYLQTQSLSAVFHYLQREPKLLLHTTLNVRTISRFPSWLNHFPFSTMTDAFPVFCGVEGGISKSRRHLGEARRTSSPLLRRLKNEEQVWKAKGKIKMNKKANSR